VLDVPLISSLLDVPLDRGERNAKHLDNLSPGIAMVYGSQNMLA
jgi:hypothetical protein